MQLTFEPVWPWPLVLLAAAALSVLVVVAYRRQAQTLTPQRRSLLLGLKLASLAVVVFTLFRPAVLHSDKEEQVAQLLIVTDVSRSMNTTDVTGGRTRLQAALQDLDQQAELWTRLGKQLAIRRFEFDRDVRPWKEGRTTGEGEQTALGHMLDEVLRETRQQPTAAVLLQTDGAQRALPPYDVDPLLAARKFAEVQIPVYPLGYGSTALSTNTIDLALRDLLVGSVVFEKKLVPVKVQLQALGARGKKVQVRLLLEDRGSVAPGETGPLVPVPLTAAARPVQEIEVRSDQQILPVDLSFVPLQAGELKVAVEVSPLTGEVLTANNRVETIITVRGGGLRVAYFDLPRPEQRMLRIVNTEEKIQLDFHDVRGGRFRAQTVIAPEWFERGKYDVYLIGDVPADVFGPQLLEKLAERVREGAGLMMLGGLQNYSAGGYASTPLADLLPVVLSPAAPSAKPSLEGQLVGPQRMVPTDLGLKRFVMQLAPAEKNRARWEALAPLLGATRLTPKHELVEVWAQTRAGEPLLLAAEIGRARVVAFGGDTTYQWVLHGQGEEHQRFWRQMILWLARKEADDSQGVWVRIDPRNYIPGATVGLECGARDAQGQPLEGVTYYIDITDPTGKGSSITPRLTPTGAAAEFRQTLEPGDYWVRVKALKDGQAIGMGAISRFIVDPRDLELDQPNADYELLRQIAEITGGQVIRSEELPGFLERLAQLKREDLSRVTVTPLWDNPWVLLLFVALLTAEWALRRKWGLA